MFYTKKHKATVEMLYGMVQDQRVLLAKQQEKLSFLFSRIENHIATTHPHGTKKDGTPRAKPGRKLA